MLQNLPVDIIINIIYLCPIKSNNISLYIYNIINYNNHLIKYINTTFYYNFNLFYIFNNNYNIINNYNIFKYSKTISYFFHTNLSINEKILLTNFYYIGPKRYYWLEHIYKHLYQYINFYIIYYSINQYDTFVDKLNLYVENKNIISTEIIYNNHLTKHYVLYKTSGSFKYSFIIKPDTCLDYSLYLLNNYLNTIIK